MTVQWLAAVFCIGIASCYLCYHGIRAWKGQKAGCAGGCDCSATALPTPDSRERIAFIPSDQLTLRRRSTQ